MRYTWQFFSVLTLVALILYAPTLKNGFLFEDEAVLKPLPDAPVAADYRRAATEATAEIGWRPLARLSLMAQKGMTGVPTPVPYRLFNIFLVLAAGSLAYALMRQAPLGIRQIPAFLAALLLVAHPVTSASVYRITEGRSILLGTVFLLGSAALYIRGGRWNAAGALLLFSLALGSHAQAIWLPLVLAVGDGVGLSRLGAQGESDQNGGNGFTHLKVVLPPSRPGMARWWGLAPFLMVALIYLKARQVCLGGLIAGDPTGNRMPFHEWLYAWQVLAAPSRVVVFEPPLVSWLNSWHLLAGVVFLFAVVAAVVAALSHPEATPPERQQDERRRLAFWGAWLVAGMPAMVNALAGGGLFDEGDVLVFSVGVWGLLAWVVSRFWEWEWIRREGLVLTVAALFVLGGVNLGRLDYYRDDGRFISHWSRSHPEAWRIFARRAAAWSKLGLQEAADRQVERGLMLKPDEPELLLLKGESQEKAGRLEEALETYQGLAAANASNLEARVKAADVTLQLGRHREAAGLYRALTNALPEDEAIRVKLEAAVNADLEKGQ